MLCIFLLHLEAFNEPGKGWISLSHHMLYEMIPPLEDIVGLVISILDTLVMIPFVYAKEWGRSSNWTTAVCISDWFPPYIVKTSLCNVGDE